MNRKLAALTLSLICGVYAGGAFAQAAPSNTAPTPMTSADKKAAKAQEKADQKSAEAQQEANKKALIAQAKADKVRTEAQGDANNKKADANLSDAKDQ
jgi:Na+/glutamate symporter